MLNTGWICFMVLASNMPWYHFPLFFFLIYAVKDLLLRGTQICISNCTILSSYLMKVCSCFANKPLKQKGRALLWARHMKVIWTLSPTLNIITLNTIILHKRHISGNTLIMIIYQINEVHCFVCFFWPNESSELKYDFSNRASQWSFVAEVYILKINVFWIEVGN